MDDETVERYRSTYRDEEPLYAVEREAVETLPDAFREGDYGPRDAEWVVQWYFRRFLGAYPGAQRRRIEGEFEAADPADVRAAIAAACDAPDYEAALSALLDLSGVDVGVGSAFLLFVDPDRYQVVGEREWRVVADLTDLDSESPDSLDVDDYGRFLDAARDLAARHDGLTQWDLYTVLWRRWKDKYGPEVE
ncbi:hypothetical protein [Halobacterium rubrum]|uniref:hypothetical protein n=1 Tax=Halobacterium TaxID=2239 RepID=UPI001F32268B|nr:MULTISPECIES: hypothetical protein [Halobacterium]MDH5020431.1 hypothetical protein [Halobacterium rubrum]